MTQKLLNEAFSTKITIIIYKRVFHVALNTYVPIFWGLDAYGGRKLWTDTHTHTRARARDSHINDNNLFKALKLIRAAQH